MKFTKIIFILYLFKTVKLEVFCLNFAGSLSFIIEKEHLNSISAMPQ